MSQRSLQLLLLPLAVLAGAVGLAACGDSSGPGRPDAAKGAPNFVVITIDDATLDQVNETTMPTAMRELAGAGTTFSNFIVPMPLCCPSRAAYLTGQYGHNNGVLRNNYRELNEKSNILPRWLQGAGYKTLHVGKYLNNFTSGLKSPLDVPKGWDEWFTPLGNKYYGYRVSDNGEQVNFGSDPDDYLTRVLNRRSVELIDSYADRKRPFYLQLDQHAPHAWGTGAPDDRCRNSATPDPDDYDLIDRIEVPEDPARNEADMSDKPAFLQTLERMSPAEVRKAKVNYRCAAAALRAVDRGLAEIIKALRDKGALADTAIILTSDNGYFFGEHRIPAKKEYPYQENLKMPLLVRLPAGVGPRKPVERVDELTGNVDLAPTILELAEAQPCKPNGSCRLIDGRSLMPLLDPGHGRDWPRDRTLPIELLQTPKSEQRRVRPCAFEGVRAEGWLYVRYTSVALIGGHCEPPKGPATELYDLKRDPDELENLAGTAAARKTERSLRRKQQQLRDCAGNRSDPDAGPDACE